MKQCAHLVALQYVALHNVALHNVASHHSELILSRVVQCSIAQAKLRCACDRERLKIFERGGGALAYRS